jgi:hypothetical protein
MPVAVTRLERSMEYKGKAISLEAWDGPQGSRRLRLSEVNGIGPTHIFQMPKLLSLLQDFLIIREPTHRGKSYHTSDITIGIKYYLYRMWH